MDVSNGKTKPNSNPPDFDVPENQKNADWYAQYIRYFSKFYNANNNILTVDDYRGNQLPVQRGLSMFLYYMGQQQNIDYAYATKDLSNNTLPAIWIPGKKVRSLIDYMLGSLRGQFDTKIIGTTALSKRAVSTRTKKLDATMLKYDDLIKDKLDELKPMGVDFQPEGKNKFESQDDAKEWFNYTYRDSAEVYAEWIAKYIEESNDADSLYIKAALDYFAANYTAIHNYVENGKVYQKHIPFYNVIWDSRVDDKYNRDGRFVGYRELLTPQECFHKYPELTEEERKEIKTIATDEIKWNDTTMLYNVPNLNWWSSYPTGERLVSCVTMYWISTRDTKWKQGKDADGNIEYTKVKKNKSGEYGVEDVYRGTLIGNRFLVKYGLSDNVVRNPENKSKPELPIKIYTGNTILSDGVSPIGLVAQSQDRIDFYRYKIIETMGRAAGKVYLINGNKLSESVTGKQLLTDFKTMGLSVVNSRSGESDDPDDRAALVQTVDMMLDPSIKEYWTAIQIEEQLMEQTLSTSKTAMGAVQPQLGKSVQQAAVQASTTGLTNFYKDFLYYNQINLQYASNLAKIVYSMDDNFEAPMVVGDRGIYFLKVGKAFRWEDILIYLRVKDVIGEDDKQRYIQIASAIAQQGGMNMLDFMRIDTAESKKELIKDLEKAVEKQEQKIAQQQQIQFQQKAALQQQNLQAMGENEALRQHAEDMRSDKRDQVKVIDSMLKHGAATQQE